jgi:hypothetical protein
MRSALVICDSETADNRQTLLDHMRFLDHAPAGTLEVTYIDLFEKPAFDPKWLEADFAVLHTTVLAYRWNRLLHTVHQSIDWLARFPGVIAAVPQDEYDHALLLDEWLAVLGTRLVVSCFDHTHRPLMYPRMHRRARFMVGLTGYLHPARVEEARVNGLPHAERTIDVFYRGRTLPYSFGFLGHLKSELGKRAPEILADTGLRLNISSRPEDTLLGDRWLQTLGSSVSTLGSQSGSSVLDRRGEMTLHVRGLLSANPAMTFAQADEALGGELSRYHFSALGPRHLEAVMTRTVQVLVEDAYSGVFTPWVHYIPLKSDLSNLRDLPELLRDQALTERLTERAYTDFVVSGAYSYEKFALDFLAEIDAVRAGDAPVVRRAA